jgi:hypothetical protein
VLLLEQLVVTHQRADPERVAVAPQRAEAGDPVDVDQDARPGQPHRQYGSQALTAGDDLPVAPGVDEAADDACHAVGTDVVEGRSLHWMLTFP